MTTLPTWAVFAISFGSPALAFVGVLVAQWLTRRSAKELEARSKREEVMRNLRWAAELAVSEEGHKAQLGVSQLLALTESTLLDDSQKLFIDAALESVVKIPAEEIEDIEKGGEDAEVLEVIGDHVTLPNEVEVALSSDQGGVRSGHERGGDDEEGLREPGSEERG